METNTWFTADWHLGENRFDIMGRPFKTTEEHNNTLIRNHNSVVHPDDIVFVIGDAVYQKRPEFLDLVSHFHGKKILIRGNHDAVFTDDQLKPYFHTIVKEGEGVEVTINELQCWLTHYPSRGKSDKFNIVGHVHGAWKYQLNMFNIGVDTHHYFPVKASSVNDAYKAIKDFYDDDVWVAYNPINHNFHGNGRGKTGTYFKG